MRKSFLVIGGFLAATVISLLIGAAAPAPIYRNQWTTNVPGQAVIGGGTLVGSFLFDSALGVGSGGNIITLDPVNMQIVFNSASVGDLGFATGGGTLTAGNTTISGPSTTIPALKVFGAANSSTNLFEVRSNSTLLIFSIGSNGVVTIGGVGNIINAGTIASVGTIQTSGDLRWNASSRLNATPVNGNISLKNSGATSFGSLQWGGTTTNWPAFTLIQSGTNSVANVLGLGDATSGASGAMLEIKATPNSMTNNNPSADSARIFASLDGGGVAQLWVKAEDGTTKQITEHAIADAPPFMLDGFDDMPNISKEIQPYLGKVRWINRSREALLTQMQFWGTNVLAMPTNKTTFIYVESFTKYNNRLGLTNGNGLVQFSWAGVQAEHQAAYDAGRLNDLAQVDAGFTNVVVRPVADIRKPVPAWLSARGAN